MIKKRSMVATVESVTPDFIQFGDAPGRKQVTVNLGDQVRIRANEGDALFDSIVKRVRGGVELTMDYQEIVEDKRKEKLATGAEISVGSGWFTVQGVEITDAKAGEISKLLEERLEEAASELSFPDQPRRVETNRTKSKDDVPEFKPADAGAAATTAGGAAVEKF
jgi:hypothetical protein